MDRGNGNKQKIVITSLVVIVLVLIGALILNGKSNTPVEKKGTDAENAIKATSTNTAVAVTPTTKLVISPTSSTTDITPTDGDETKITPSPRPSGTVTPTEEDENDGSPKDVRVYYSVDPESFDQPGYAFYFEYNTDRTDPENFVIEQIIEGPSQEFVDEYKVFSPIELTGESNCSGKDFTLDVDKSKKTATLNFCKDLATPEEGDLDRVVSVITTALEEFDYIESVEILDKSGQSL